MIRYFVSLLLLLLLAAMIQLFLPVIGPLLDARLMLLLLVFLCAAVTVPTPIVLFFAFLCGFLTDLETTLSPFTGDPKIYTHPPHLLYFGYSIILYGLAGMIMQGIRPLFTRGNYYVPAILVGVIIFLYLITEYLLINFIRGELIFTSATFLKISFSAGLTMLLAPLVYWLLFALAMRFDYLIQNVPEVNSFAKYRNPHNLNRRRR